MDLNRKIEGLSLEIKSNFINRSFKKGQYIIRQGDSNEYLYFILEGEVEVFTESHQGARIKLRDHKALDSFGVLELFKNTFKTQSCIAKTDCRLIKLHKDYVLKWMEEDFEFNLYIIDLLLLCYDQSNEVSLSLSTMTVKERFLRAVYLHYVDKTLDQVDKDTLMKEIVVPLRSLNRVIKECQSEGYIIYEDKRIKVKDIEKLEYATAFLI